MDKEENQSFWVLSQNLFDPNRYISYVQLKQKKTYNK